MRTRISREHKRIKIIWKPKTLLFTDNSSQLTVEKSAETAQVAARIAVEAANELAVEAVVERLLGEILESEEAA